MDELMVTITLEEYRRLVGEEERLKALCMELGRMWDIDSENYSPSSDEMLLANYYDIEFPRYRKALEKKAKREKESVEGKDNE
ncbi:hypothetical protein M2149_000819 [Lachnospiraceae bacterium PFB1-21]